MRHIYKLDSFANLIGQTNYLGISFFQQLWLLYIAALSQISNTQISKAELQHTQWMNKRGIILRYGKM